MGKTSLRIMFMNVENLFSPGQSFYGSYYNQQEYDDKTEWIADMIARAQVHVVGLTEIGEDSVVCITDVLEKLNFDITRIFVDNDNDQIYMEMFGFAK